MKDILEVVALALFFTLLFFVVNPEKAASTFGNMVYEFNRAMEGR
jgi:hypothetical protein